MLYLRKYKFWKQFTTKVELFSVNSELCCIYENTNFESNSQHNRIKILIKLCCVVSTKIQILKAIHNAIILVQILKCVVLYLRKYKFWKQFTTFRGMNRAKSLLCCIYENTNFLSNSQLKPLPRSHFLSCVVSTKIQILKAIHNAVPVF